MTELSGRPGGGGNLERELLERLYCRYYKELYVYVYSLCGYREVTEDILQEVFLKAFLALKDSHTNMRAWLYLVARNLCYDWFRREKRAPVERMDGQVFEETEGKRRTGRQKEEAAGDRGRSQNPLEILLWKEEKDAVRRALGKLSWQKREVLVLQFFGGFGQKEIAAMMRLTPENVRVLAFRARKELRELLEKEEEKKETN